MKKIIVAAIASATLTGCITPEEYEAKIQTGDPVSVCQEYEGLALYDRSQSIADQRAGILNTLLERGAVTKREASSIREGKIYLGMSEIALNCAWGRPDTVNTSVGSWGVHKQYVYGDNYAYVENGTVKSWQN